LQLKLKVNNFEVHKAIFKKLLIAMGIELMADQQFSDEILETRLTQSMSHSQNLMTDSTDTELFRISYALK